MAEEGIATFRFNFPYMEHGKGATPGVCTATVRSAVAAAHEAVSDLPLLAGGHSFGGRMTSTAASESSLDGVHGLVFFAFPLHQPGKPDTKRGDHLTAVTVPMLFLSGTRDELADLDLLRPVCKKLGKRGPSTPWTLLTTAFAPSNARARARRTYSSRWLRLSRSGLADCTKCRQTPQDTV